jgi:hypothetical protein
MVYFVYELGGLLLLPWWRTNPRAWCGGSFHG